MSIGTERSFLLRKLDEFIRKYYKNQLLKGGILSLASLLVTYLCITSLEYFGHFPSLVRSVLFYGFLAFTLWIIGNWVVLPAIRLFHLGHSIGHKEAARIIGSHFPEVRDKLLNTLELQEQVDRGESVQGASTDLIRASIDQRIVDLKPIPFKRAIDLSANRRYLKYALPPLLIFLILLFGAPNVLRDGTQRIVEHGSRFEPEAPFDFSVRNDSLKVVEKKNFRLNVNIEGEELPAKAYIRMKGRRFKLKKENEGSFYHEFKGVNKNVDFQLAASGFRSKPYELETLPDPQLVEFQVTAKPPAYTGLEQIEKSNSGDLNVPEGTKIEWSFRTKKADELRFRMGDSIYNPERMDSDRYRMIRRVHDDHPYRVQPANKYVKDRKGIQYRIRVKQDRYPKIKVEERVDSLTEKKRFFRGKIEDDHGFTKLRFHYRTIRKGQKEAPNKEMKVESLSVPKGKTSEAFFHSWSLSELGIRAGDRVEYHFSVTDNDGVNGPKTSRSKEMTYRAPTKSELRKKEEKTERKIKKDLKEGIEESKELQKKISEVRKDLLNKKNAGWKVKKKVEEAIDQQKELQDRMNKISKKRDQMEQRSSDFKEKNEEIKKKQKKLEKLFDKVMSEKMKKTLKELQKRMDEMSRKEMQKKMEEMKLSNKELEKKLDRNLEMFKQLEFEKELQEKVEQMKEMEKEQKELAKKSEKSKSQSRTDSLKKKQDSLNQAFEKTRQGLDSLRKKNQELENSHKMKDTEKMEESIKKEMKQSSKELQKGQKKDASQKQKGASKKMGKLSQSLKQMKKKMEKKTMQMNMDDLRALLNNLIELSFDQEALMDRVKKSNTDDPAYTDLGQEQKRIREDFGKIKDSLYELSKQVFQLKATIDQEVEKAERNMRKSIDLLSKRDPGKAASREQYTMTAMNELALLLDESLKSMQKKMAMKMSGKGNCQKPGGSGGGKKSLSQLRKMQQKLNERLKQMQKKGGGQKNGGKSGDGQKGKGGKKKGENGKNGKGGMSKELAKMAREQAAIRRRIQELSQKMDPSGKGIGNELQRIAEQMEKSEKDIVDRAIDQRTIERQSKIKSRLLESEKAERKRGYKKERKAEQAKDQEYSNPEEFFEYKRKKEREVELLKTVPPTLRPYYKNKVDRYFERYQDQDR